MNCTLDCDEREKGTLIKKTLSFSFNFSPFVQAQVVG